MKTYYKIGIIVLGVVILGVLAWFLFLQPGGQSTQRGPKTLDQILTDLSGNSPDEFVTNTGGQPTGGQSGAGTEGTEVNLIAPSQGELAEQELEQLVARFVERWGTYSNQTDLSNIRSLKSQVTSRMQNFIDEYIENIRQEHPYQSGYYGLTTKVVSVNLNNFTEGATTLEAVVGTRQAETLDNNAPISFNQSASIDLMRVNGEWKIDGVFWAAR